MKRVGQQAPSRSLLKRASARSLATPATGSSRFAIAFDVDGVLLRGGEPVPGAREVLDFLDENNVPHVFMTNGGGTTEAKKAESMAKCLGRKVEDSRVVLGHTPMRSLQAKHHNDNVLVVGKHYEKLLPILHAYGLPKTTTTEEYHRQRPACYPDLPVEGQAQDPSSQEPIKAVCVMNDPLYWGRDLQILCDVIEDSGHTVPVYSACADLQYSSDYPSPRFGNGAFRHAFDALYGAVHGEAYPKQVLYGKPNKVSYDYVEKVLEEEELRLGGEPIEAVYMIGDNPETDILGARNAGGKWRSVLTLSGLFSGGEHHADALVKDVSEALEYIRSRHK